MWILVKCFELIFFFGFGKGERKVEYKYYKVNIIFVLKSEKVVLFFLFLEFRKIVMIRWIDSTFEDKERSLDDIKLLFIRMLLLWASTIDYNGLNLHDFLFAWFS